MRRRWTTDQYMDRYERRLERREFYKAYDDVTHPPSPDGTRLCKNCAKNETCGLNRRRNHGSCFARIGEEEKATSKPDAESSEGNGTVVVVAILILGLIYLISPALFCIAVVAFIFFGMIA